MTSLNINIFPSGDESCSVFRCVDDRPSAHDNSSVGTVGVNNHIPAEDHTSVGAGCSCDHSSVYIPGVLTPGGLDDVPGETTTE